MKDIRTIDSTNGDTLVTMSDNSRVRYTNQSSIHPNILQKHDDDRDYCVGRREYVARLKNQWRRDKGQFEGPATKRS